jgi:hypothetical protein
MGLLVSTGFIHPTVKPSFATDAKPVIDKYCVPCHSGANPPAGVLLTKKFSTDADGRELWSRVAAIMTKGVMPPPGSAQPPAAARKKAIDAISAELAAA